MGYTFCVITTVHRHYCPAIPTETDGATRSRWNRSLQMVSQCSCLLLSFQGRIGNFVLREPMIVGSDLVSGCVFVATRQGTHHPREIPSMPLAPDLSILLQSALDIVAGRYINVIAGFPRSGLHPTRISCYSLRGPVSQGWQYMWYQVSVLHLCT
jgi:hypothetical protein